MPTPREVTRPDTTSALVDSTPMSRLARPVSGMVSVGLNAVPFPAREPERLLAGGQLDSDVRHAVRRPGQGGDADTRAVLVRRAPP